MLHTAYRPMKKSLLTVIVFAFLLRGLSAQELSIWTIQNGLPYQKTDTLLVNQGFFLGIEARVDQQRASLLSRGFAEISWFPVGGYMANTFTLARSPGGQGGLGFISMGWGDGSRRTGQGGDNPWMVFQEISGGSMSYVSSPTFNPITYMGHGYSSQGTYTIDFYADLLYDIWDANRTLYYEQTTLTKTVNVVPEPSSLSLLALGGVLLALRGRR